MVEQKSTILKQPYIAESDLVIWTWLVKRGIINSIAGLSKMVGKAFSVSDLKVTKMPARDTVYLLGGSDNPVICIDLSINGDTSGHLMLVHDPQVAFSLIDNQMGLAPGSTHELGEIELSLLGEMGNIVGAFFLNILADVTNLYLSPSPPDVIIDTAGSVVNSALKKLINDEDIVFTIKATFGTPDHQTDGTFLVIPTMDFMSFILKHARTL
jgi:chemotaxis protein CheC